MARARANSKILTNSILAIAAFALRS